MKRLFALKHQDGNLFLAMPIKLGEPLCFETKREAKERRDEVNNLHGEGYVCVTAGPDHHGKTASQNRHTRKRKLRGTRPAKIRN